MYLHGGVGAVHFLVGSPIRSKKMNAMTTFSSILRSRGQALAASIVAGLVLSSCATQGPGGPGGDAEALAEAARVHRAQTAAYQTEQRRIAQETSFPLALEFPDRGSVLVHRVELLGGPDTPYLRARFTYVNTTGGSLPIPTIEFRAHTGDGSVPHSATRRLTRLLDPTIGDDMAHSAWIDLDVDLVIGDPQWSWSFEVIHAGLPEGPRDRRKSPPPALSSGRGE